MSLKLFAFTCGTVTGVITVSGLNGVVSGVGFTTRIVMYAVSPGASVTLFRMA